MKNKEVEIKEVIAKLFDMEKEHIFNYYVEFYTHKMEYLKKFIGMSDWSKEVRSEMYYNCDQLKREIWDLCFSKKNTSSISDDPRFLVKDWKEKITNKAKKYTEMVMAGFLEKMNDKLAGVIKEKKISSYSVHGLHEGYVSLKFTDGSAFDISNSVTFCQNSHGTCYEMYPTRYHKVIMSDGTQMKKVNEKKMKESF